MKNTCEKTLDGLTATARSLGTPGDVIAEARAATALRFGGSGRADASRVGSYFWGVVRKRALRGGAPAVGALLVMDSMWSDMAEAGHRPESILRELRTTFGESDCRRYVESRCRTIAA